MIIASWMKTKRIFTPRKVKTMRHRSRSLSRDESGAVVVLTAIIIVVLLGFAALAIDIGHLMVVKNELQNAADAGALAGANNFAPYLLTDPPTPDFSAAQVAANSTTKANQTDKTLITDCQVEVGYFNLVTRDLQLSTISPTTVDVPAVRVTVSRIAGQNQGAVLPFIGQVLGINFMNVSAQAIGMLSCPSTAPPNTLLPIAINKQVLPYLWKTTDSNNANLSQPFNIGSDYHYPDISGGGDTVAGEWTSFFDVKNDTTTIRDLLYNRNPNPVGLAQMIQCLSDIYVQPGTKNALYADVTNVMNSNGPNFTYYLPVVNLNSLDTHAWNPVLCYIPVKLLDSVGKNKKYVQAQFVKKAHVPWNNVGGPCYGAYGSPRMVQ
jgi:Flp pilus assembly protein TadG